MLRVFQKAVVAAASPAVRTMAVRTLHAATAVRAASLVDKWLSTPAQEAAEFLAKSADERAALDRAEWEAELASPDHPLRKALPDLDVKEFIKDAEKFQLPNGGIDFGAFTEKLRASPARLSEELSAVQGLDGGVFGEIIADIKDTVKREETDMRAISQKFAVLQALQESVMKNPIDKHGAINWDDWRARVPIPGAVDRIEAAFNALSEPRYEEYGFVVKDFDEHVAKGVLDLVSSVQADADALKQTRDGVQGELDELANATPLNEVIVEQELKTFAGMQEEIDAELEAGEYDSDVEEAKPEAH